MSKNGNLVILAGSGLSRPAGLPSIDEITEQVLTAKHVSKHVIYNIDEELAKSCRQGTLPWNSYVEFIRQLKDFVDPYFQNGFQTEASYEDLYAVIEKIHASQDVDYQDPTFQQFKTALRSNINDWFKRHEYNKDVFDGPDGPADQLFENAFEMLDYIRDMVWQKVAVSPTSLDYFGIFNEAYTDQDIRQIDIFTVNHDTLIEQYLHQRRIMFSDGWGEEDGEIRHWDDKVYDHTDAKVRLFKLHGSIDWYIADFENSIELVQSGFGPAQHTLRTDSGHAFAPDSRPMILVGTLAKAEKYFGRTLADIHGYFRASKLISDCLLVIGYGFRDENINNCLFQWLASSPAKRLRIIDENRSVFARDIRFAKNMSKVELKEGKIEDFTWKEIKAIVFE